MFSFFPCNWIQPKPKWLIKAEQHNGGDIVVKKPVVVKINLPKTGSKALNVMSCDKKPIKKPNNIFPTCEMLKAGEEIDTTEIDRMLDEICWEIERDYGDEHTNKIMQMIRTVNHEIIKNMEIIKNVSYDENVNSKEVLKLLEMFLNYSRTLENYIKVKRLTK